MDYKLAPVFYDAKYPSVKITENANIIHISYKKSTER